MTAIISNAASPYKRPLFKHGLDSLVDEYLFSCDAGCMKPQEEIYQRMLMQLGVRASQALMIGDSRTCDYDAPRSIGIQSIHLVRGGRAPDAMMLDAVLSHL